MNARLAGSWIGYHARVSPGQTAIHDLASGERLTYAELDDGSSDRDCARTMQNATFWLPVHYLAGRPP